MKRLLLSFAVITIFNTAVCAQERGAAARPESPAAKWSTYTSPDGQYSVSFTQPPELSTQNLNQASGLVLHMATASADPAYVMVGYLDLPATTTFSLDAARNSMVNSIHGNLVDEASISLGGSPGRAVKIAAKTDAGIEFTDRARLYDINRRIYVLQCVVPAANEGQSAIKICDQFFDSFRVKNSPN